MRVTIEVGGNIAWVAKRSGQSDRWIGICEPMGLTVDAATLDELHSVIAETMYLVLTDLLEDNELDAFLRKRGWTAVQDSAAGERSPEFNVPWELIAEGARDPERRPH